MELATDPLESAIRGLMILARPTWTPLDSARVSETGGKAADLLTRSGFIAAHCRCGFTLDIPESETFWLQFELRGNWQQSQLEQQIFQQMPSAWLDSDGRTVAKTFIDWRGFHELRLTSNGELARPDVVTLNSEYFFDHVLRRGMAQYTSPWPSGSVIVDDRGTGALPDLRQDSDDSGSPAEPEAGRITAPTGVDLETLTAAFVAAMKQFGVPLEVQEAIAGQTESGNPNPENAADCVNITPESQSDPVDREFEAEPTSQDAGVRANSSNRESQSETETASTTSRIVWNPESRTLTVDGQAFPSLAGQATSLKLVLDAFQSAGWPENIESPFTTSEKNGEKGAIRRLNEKFNPHRFEPFKKESKNYISFAIND